MKMGGVEMTQKEDGLMTPAYWEMRAEEARTRADGIRDSAASDLMLRIARTYDAMAERVRTRRIFSTESTAY